MSLFKEYEKTASVYHINDSNAAKKGSYPSTASFMIDINIIRRSVETTVLLGTEIAEYVASVNGKYTNADQFKSGDKVVWDGNTYIVENKPKYVRLFDRYKLILRASD